jgi:uncharacterized protein
VVPRYGWAAAGKAGPGELACFLTVRYCLFTVIASRLAARQGRTPPVAAAARRGALPDQDMLQRARLPAHALPGMPVRIGMWHW